jgi:phosphatidylglycerophosphate synthase
VLVAILRAGRRAADGVTIARFVGLLVAIWLAEGGSPSAWLVAVAVVLLDLVDGAVARRFGGSPQGAVLDMETDQLTVLGLSMLVVLGGGGVHVLLLPALRYLFVLWMWWAVAPAHEPKPVDGDNRRGRFVCACVMVALLVALWPALPPLLGDAVTAVAALLLAWSFSGDARFLLAHRRAARSRA